MNTKLVYVLTCKPEGYYIEQALISIYSARYHNPDATIVLLTDNLTNKLLVGVRSQINNYISEKIIIELPSEMTAMKRSRHIKTSCRNFVDGDMLYIDCDTIITRSLKDIDNLSCEIGAVPDSHLPIKQLNHFLIDKLEYNSKMLEWDYTNEIYYFSSGVIFVKDTAKSKEFFDTWHKEWNNGLEKGINIDQPSFAKTNILHDNIIKKIDDTWNCVMYIHPLFDRKGKILHFSFYRNMSYVFGEHFLEKVKTNNINQNDFIIYSVLNPYITYIPFDNSVYSYSLKDYLRMFKEIRHTSKLIVKNLDASFKYYFGNTRIEKIAINLFCKNLFMLGAALITLYKFYRVKINKKYKFIENTCSK